MIFDSKAHEEKLLESLIDTFKKKCMREVSGSVGDGRFFLEGSLAIWRINHGYIW